MARMTEEEADALDELWTKTTPDIDTSKPGYFTSRMAHFIEVDDIADTWLRVKSEATNKSRSEIIGELIREKIAAYA